MRLKLLVLCQKGYSLVEIMVGLVITGIVTYGVLLALSNHQKASITAKRNIEFKDITAVISMYLSHKESCTKLFENYKITYPILNNTSPKSLSPSEMFQFPTLSYQGTNIAEVGVEKNGLKPSTVALTKVYKSFTNNINNFYVFDFSFAVEKIGNMYGGNSLDKTFQIFIKTTPDGKVVNCGSVENSDEGHCLLSGKVYDQFTIPFCK